MWMWVRLPLRLFGPGTGPLTRRLSLHLSHPRLATTAFTRRRTDNQTTHQHLTQQHRDRGQLSGKQASKTCTRIVGRLLMCQGKKDCSVPPKLPTYRGGLRRSDRASEYAVCSRGDRRRVPHGLDLALGPDPVSGPQSGHAGGPIAHRWPVCTPGSPSCSRLRYQIPATRTHRSWTVTAWGAMRR